MDKSRKPVILNVIHHGQSPSECKKTGSVEMSESIVARPREQIAKPPQESLIHCAGKKTIEV
jgi:hypothetical protein